MLFEGAHGQVRGAQLRHWIAGFAVAGTVVACKPTAIITVQPTRLSSLQSSGALGGQCTETSPDARPVLRFTMESTNGDAIVPGMTVNGEDLLLGVNFTPDNLLVAGNSGTLFPSPDVDCPEFDPTTLPPNTPCPDAALAAAGFVCQPIAPAAANDSQGRVVCALPEFPVEISPNATLEYEGDEVRKKAVIGLIANGATVFGLDSDGSPSRRACSTDPDRHRTTGFTEFLRSLNEDTNPFAADTDVCMATFLGQSEPNYRHPAGGTAADCFQPISVMGDPNRGYAFLDTSVNQIANDAAIGGRNPWAAIIDASERFNDWASPSQDRHIVMFTDGGPSFDVRETADAFNHTYEAAEQAALNNDVTVHIVQLDRRDRGDNCSPPTEHGALEQFSRLACATGGNFAYVEDATDVPDAVKNMALSVPGHYEMELVAERLAVMPIGAYKLDISVAVEVNGNTGTLSFSALGSSSRARVDNRIPLMNRGACASGECLNGYQCTDDSLTCQPPYAEATP